jgi:hypothetical protein
LDCCAPDSLKTANSGDSAVDCKRPPRIAGVESTEPEDSAGRTDVLVTNTNSGGFSRMALKPPTERRARIRHGVCVVSALECQGLISLWQILSVTMIPDHVRMTLCCFGTGEFLSSVESIWLSCDWPPPEPPPRIGVAGTTTA